MTWEHRTFTYTQIRRVAECAIVCSECTIGPKGKEEQCDVYKSLLCGLEGEKIEFLFSRREIMQNLIREMASPNKTERKSLNDILRDRARPLTQRVADQRHLEEIARKVKGIRGLFESMRGDIAESAA